MQTRQDSQNASSTFPLAEVAARFLRVGFTTVIIAILSMILLFRYQINSTWLIAVGALAGLLISFVQ